MVNVRIHQAGFSADGKQRCMHCQRVLVENPLWRALPMGRAVAEVLRDGQPLQPPLFYSSTLPESPATCISAA